MALPPEPIEEVLGDAKWVIEAEVAEVLETAPSPPEPPRPQGFVGPGRAPRQIVRLKLRRILRGAGIPETFEAVKPEAGYALRAGNHGPFLLSGTTRPIILGTYGPDTWSLGEVERAVGASGA